MLTELAILDFRSRLAALPDGRMVVSMLGHSAAAAPSEAAFGGILRKLLLVEHVSILVIGFLLVQIWFRAGPLYVILLVPFAALALWAIRTLVVRVSVRDWEWCEWQPAHQRPIETPFSNELPAVTGIWAGLLLCLIAVVVGVDPGAIHWLGGFFGALGLVTSVWSVKHLCHVARRSPDRSSMRMTEGPRTLPPKPTR